MMLFAKLPVLLTAVLLAVPLGIGSAFPSCFEDPGLLGSPVTAQAVQLNDKFHILKKDFPKTAKAIADFHKFANAVSDAAGDLNAGNASQVSREPGPFRLTYT